MKTLPLFLTLVLCVVLTSALHAQSTTATVIRPYITNYSPSILALGGPATTIILTGRRFQQGAQVSLNGQPLTEVTVTGDSSISALVPAALLNKPDLATLLVVNPDQKAIGLRITIGDVSPCAPLNPCAIRIVDVSPSSTTGNATAFVLTITGSGFAGVPRVFLGGQQLQVVSSTLTGIVAIVPANLNIAGTYQLQVVNNFGVVASSQYVINQPPSFLPPSITRITPPFSFGAWGRNITITGTNFAPGVVVLVGALRLVVVSVSTTNIVATTPAGTPEGYYLLRVINPDGQQASQQWSLGVGVEFKSNITHLYPNPTPNTLTFETQLERASTLTFTLRNILGTSVLQEQHTAASGRFSATMDAGALPNGVYVLEVNSNVGRWVQKVVKY